MLNLGGNFVQIIAGMCGSDTEFLRMPGGKTYRAAAARAGGFGRSEAEEAAQLAARMARERREWEAEHPRISLAAQSIGQADPRWEGTKGLRTKHWATIYDAKR